MSNLSGSVCVVRERERRARLQLLDEIREPSPQPIFGEPIKVDPSLEDETSRRIKDTLGDFNQVQHVLINDPKHLIGISRSSGVVRNDHRSKSSPHPTMARHLQSISGFSHSSEKPVLHNGMHKSSSVSSHNDVHKVVHVPSDKSSSENKIALKQRVDSSRISNAIHPGVPNSSSQPGERPRDKSKDYNRSREKSNSIPSLPSASSLNVGNSVNGTSNILPAANDISETTTKPPHASYSGIRPNGIMHQHKNDSNKRTQAKHVLPKLSIPVETHNETHLEIESILREMKQAVPPPLTAIQTPKAEESGFSFPFPSVDCEEMPSEKPEEQTCSLGAMPPVTLEAPPNKEDHPSLLQADLEVSSDSEDDVKPVLENPSEAVEFLKMPERNTMDQLSPQAQSSSSGSSGSDSEDSSSGTNDTDSSESSEAEPDTPITPPPQMWGLSNFLGETRKNNSPAAFMPLDTSTNSSNTGIKEETILSSVPEKNNFSLVDEDSVNLFFVDYPSNDMKGYIQSPIRKFLDDDYEDEDAPSPPDPTTGISFIRGPRTPPTPNVVQDDELKEKHVSKSQRGSKDRSENADGLCELQYGKIKIRIGKTKDSKSSECTERNRTCKAEPSASKNSVKISSSDTTQPTTAITTSTITSPVPSISAASHGNPIKTHKNSSQKNSKSYGELNDKELMREHSSKIHYLKKGDPGNAESLKCSESSQHHDSLKLETTTRPNCVSKLNKIVNSKKQDKSSSTPQKCKDSNNSKSSNHGNKHSVINSPKLKQKSKKAPAFVVDNKRQEKKIKLVKKFSIANFIQGPCSTCSNGENVEANHESALSPMQQHLCSAITGNDEQRHQKSSFSPNKTQQSSGTSSKSSSERNESKKRNYCSMVDIINSVARGDVFNHSREIKAVNSDLELSSKCVDKLLDVHMDSPVQVFSPQLLSPIPQDSPVPLVKSESAITQLLVSIPHEKLFRVPPLTVSHNPTSDKLSHMEEKPVVPKTKDVISASNENLLDISSSDKLLLLDNIKSKQRTDLQKKGTSKENRSKKEKIDKEYKHQEMISDSKSSAGNNKINKLSGETKCSKKRKPDETDKTARKKPKGISRVTNSLEKECTESPLTVKIGSASPCKSELRLSHKPLERCGSTSSLSSFSSQQSQKSIRVSKERQRERLKDESDSKKIKCSISAQLYDVETRREKEEKTKMPSKEQSTSASEKTKTKVKGSSVGKGSNKNKKFHEATWDDLHNSSSQNGHWEDSSCKSDEAKVLPTNHERQIKQENLSCDGFPELKHLSPAAQMTPKHNNNKTYVADEYYLEEAKKLKHLADKEPDPLKQAMQYLEAILLFILTGHHLEKNNREGDYIYRLYKETLNLSYSVRNSVQKSQLNASALGSVSYKLLILILRCQSLLFLKLYNLRRSEVKEQQKGVSDFMKQSTSNRLSTHLSPLPANSSSMSKNMSQPSPCPPRLGAAGGVPSPHSPTPSPAGSVNSQSSGYSSSEVNGNHSRSLSTLQTSQTSAVVSVPQNVFDMMQRQHSHLNNLHNCHEHWEQADMYMTRSHSKEFFKEVSEQSDHLTLHSSIEELVSYVQSGLSLLKKDIH